MKRIRHGYKVKLYPTKEQEQTLLKHVGSARFVYNYFLNLKKETYLTTGKNITYNQMSKQLTQLKTAEGTEWLSNIHSQALQQSLRQLDVAYNRFFRKQAQFPRFKTKYGKNTMRKVTGWHIDGNTITIMKGIDVKFRGTFPEKRYGALTVSRDIAGNWFASTWGYDESELPALTGAIGLDLGLINLVTSSDGEKYPNIRVAKGLQKRIKSASQALSRKMKGSNNRDKAKLVLARLHKKVGNVRRNSLHHISKAIVDKNHATIVVEDLAVQNMMKNRKLARSIGDAGWGELLRQITYKQEWAGGDLIKISRFFPSSKTCHLCDFVVSTLPLNVRSWECPRCHTTHDRDVNAAKVILKQGGERLGVEGGEGSNRVRSVARVTRPMKHGNIQG